VPNRRRMNSAESVEEKRPHMKDVVPFLDEWPLRVHRCR
jgi:hypothetical protein